MCQQARLWGAYALGGIIGIATVFVALRWPDLARAMVAVAGLAVLSGLFALQRVTTLVPPGRAQRHSFLLHKPCGTRPVVMHCHA